MSGRPPPRSTADAAEPDGRSARLTFTKGGGKHDQLRIERGTGAPETIACPKQGIIPHDMIHYAVESTLARRGFLSLVADGNSASFATSGGAVGDATERLVETFQAELWGGRVSASDLIATYEQACAASGHAIMPVGNAEIEAVRGRLDELGAEWENLPVGGTLSLRL